MFIKKAKYSHISSYTAFTVCYNSEVFDIIVIACTLLRLTSVTKWVMFFTAVRSLRRDWYL